MLTFVVVPIMDEKRISFTWVDAADTQSRWRIKSHSRRVIARHKALQSTRRAQDNEQGRRRDLAPAPACVSPSANILPYKLNSHVTNPRTLLDSGRVDPFAVYPIKLRTGAYEYQLIDHCK